MGAEPFSLRIVRRVAIDKGSLTVDSLTRLFSLVLRQLGTCDAVPITFGWSAPADREVTRQDVVQVVLNAFPTAGEDVPLEDVIAFRDESRSEGLPQALRVWMNEMASAKLSPIEVSDKPEDLISRYERALKLERMSRGTGIVETFVTTTAEIAESLMKFQWSKAARKLFEVRHKQIDLMKAEMGLPGREVAYIVNARGRFGS
jgi:hypothetical protein